MRHERIKPILFSENKGIIRIRTAALTLKKSLSLSPGNRVASPSEGTAERLVNRLAEQMVLEKSPEIN